MTGGVDKAGENLRAKWRAVFPPKLMAAAKTLVPPFYPSTAPSLTSAQHAAYFTAIRFEIHLWLISIGSHIYEEVYFSLKPLEVFLAQCLQP